MGLDVYVGTLTRYHSGDWETVVQQLGREQGFEVQVVREGEDPDDEVAAPEEVREAVLAWREAIGGQLGIRLEWDEGDEAPYFTDKPAWDGYGALQLLAAYDERGKDKAPKKRPEEWHDDRTWRKASKGSGSEPRYSQLYLPHLWLPAELEFLFEAQDVVGNEIPVGSSSALLAQLRELNERTLRGGPDDLAEWRAEAADADAPWEQAARFGLALFLDLAEKAVEHRLPMRLDY